MPKISTKNLKLLRTLAAVVMAVAVVCFVAIGFTRGWDKSMTGLQLTSLFAALLSFSSFAFAMDALQKLSRTPDELSADEPNEEDLNDALAGLLSNLDAAASTVEKAVLCRDIAVLQHKLGDDASAIESIKRCIDHSPNLATSLRKHQDLSGLIENSELSLLFQEEGTGSPLKVLSAWVVMGASLFVLGNSIALISVFTYFTVVGREGAAPLGEKLAILLAAVVAAVLAAFAARWGWKNRKSTKKLSVVDRQLHLQRYEALINWLVWAAVFSAFFVFYNSWSFFTEGEGLDFVSGLIVVTVAFLLLVLIIGVIKRSRVAATIFTLYQIACAIYFLPPGQPPPSYIATSITISAFLVFGTVALFMHHWLLSDEDIHEAA